MRNDNELQQSIANIKSYRVWRVENLFRGIPETEGGGAPLPLFPGSGRGSGTSPGPDPDQIPAERGRGAAGAAPPCVFLRSDTACIKILRQQVSERKKAKKSKKLRFFAFRYCLS